MPRSCATACYCVLPSYSDPVEIVWSKNLNFTLIVHISFIFKDCLIIRSSNLMLRATEYGSGTSVKEAGSVTIYTLYTLYTIYMVQVRSRRKSSEAADGGEAAVRSSLDERVLQGAIGTGQGAILNKARRCPLQSRLLNRWLPERWWFSHLKSTIVFSITKLPWWRRHRSQKRNLIFKTRSLGAPAWAATSCWRLFRPLDFVLRHWGFVTFGPIHLTRKRSDGRASNAHTHTSDVCMRFR